MSIKDLISIFASSWVVNLNEIYNVMFEYLNNSAYNLDERSILHSDIVKIFSDEHLLFTLENLIITLKKLNVDWEGPINQEYEYNIINLMYNISIIIDKTYKNKDKINFIDTKLINLTMVLNNFYHYIYNLFYEYKTIFFDKAIANKYTLNSKKYKIKNILR